MVANTPMDTDKIKIYGSRVRVESLSKVAEIEEAEKAANAPAKGRKAVAAAQTALAKAPLAAKTKASASSQRFADSQKSRASASGPKSGVGNFSSHEYQPQPAHFSGSRLSGCGWTSTHSAAMKMTT